MQLREKIKKELISLCTGELAAVILNILVRQSRLSGVARATIPD